MSNSTFAVVLLAALSAGPVCRSAFAAQPVPAGRPAMLFMEEPKADKDKDKDKEKDEKEEKVDVTKLPPAVVDGVKKEMPDGKITDAESQMMDDKKVYELDVKVGEVVYEVVVADDGKVLSKKIDDDKEDKKDKK